MWHALVLGALGGASAAVENSRCEQDLPCGRLFRCICCTFWRKHCLEHVWLADSLWRTTCRVVFIFRVFAAALCHYDFVTVLVQSELGL